MTYETILVEREDAVGIVTLNRPKVLNALSVQLLTELIDALEELDRDPEVRAIALVGSDRAFAAGADIGEMADATSIDMLRNNQFAGLERIAHFVTPVVAGVSGYALGGGCELAMACDLIVASETATFGQPEINIGVIPGAGGTQRLTRAVGKALAMDMVLTGRSISAVEARDAGLVARITAPEAWREETLAVCRTIATKSPIALQIGREAVNAAFETTLAAGIMFERRAFHVLFSSDDKREGMTAFVEKRAPAFSGS
ncbi:MAG: echA [Thermoleophilia bacterium]|nr:echA [Thermoleophilia bacterium]